MAGTGVPGCAEGLLIPAFKATSPNVSPTPSPWGFTFSTGYADRTLSIAPFPQPPLFIKFYMKSRAVNQCSQKKEEETESRGGDVQRVSERL